MHVGPLPNDVFTVERFYDRIAGAMPYRDFRPWPPMSGCCPHGDAGYQGRQFHNALKKILPHLRTQIVKRSDLAKGFVVLPKRWIVERTLAWLNRCRRLTKDWENLNRTALAFLRLASIRLMLRKLCNPH